MQTDMIELMSSQQGSPAKTSALAKEMPKASTVPALAFGQKSPELLAEYDHAGSLENVPALLDRGMHRVVGDLAAIGYDAQWQVIPATSVGTILRRSASGLLPTIPATEYKGCQKYRFRGSETFRGSKMSEGLRTSPSDPPCTTPNFAEAVMGYPKDYTLLETQQCRSLRR